MKNEYEEFRKNQTLVSQLRRDIKMKEKERNISMQQVNNLKTTITNIENIQAIIADILKLFEKVNRNKEEVKRVRSKLSDLVKNCPELKNANVSNINHQDEKELSESINNIQLEIESMRRKTNEADNQILRLQQQKEDFEKRKTSQQKESYDLESKTKELESLKNRSVELEETAKQLREEVIILRDRTEGLDEKRVKILNYNLSNILNRKIFETSANYLKKRETLSYRSY